MNYNDAIDLIRKNAFNIRLVPYELLDLVGEVENGERLLRFVRRRNAWAIDAWLVDLPKDRKAWGKEVTKTVWLDMGVIRKYEEIK